jgi:mono/diheme cytochrome c family protein
VTTNRRFRLFVLALVIGSGAAIAATGEPKKPEARQAERGKYLVLLGGCNDCHTEAFAPLDGKVAEKDWLLGNSLGFRGPWGTTYAPNLRMVIAGMSEDAWVKYARELKARPPMPWFSLNVWTEADLRAAYRYIRELGPVGKAAPAFVPPGTEPKPPFVLWPSPPR